MPATYVAPAYTDSNSGALRYRNVVSATCSTVQIIAVAESTFLNRFTAVARRRTAAKGDATTFVDRR
jgi:hypothetical protein